MVAKKAAPAAKKAVKKVAKPVAAPVKKVASKPAPAPVAKKVPAKPAVAKAVKTPVAKPAAKSVPKPAPKPVTAKSVPVNVAKTAAAPVTQPVAAKPSPATKTPQSKNPVSAPKSHVKNSVKAPVKSAAPVAVRPVGKVAVAVTARSAAPAPRSKYKVVEYKVDDATGRPILPEGYKPSADEEYMSALQQEYFRQRLQDWRADLVEESKQTIENLREEVRDIGDEAERATRETENSLELRTRDRYRKLIGKIDSTLKRLEAGDYGYCVDTGEEIGLDRLEARLTAERTIDAQERWEHLQKQQGE